MFFAKHDQQERREIAGGLASQPSAPAGLYADAEGKFAEIYGSALVSAHRMFLIAAGSILLAAAALGTLWLLLPLKEVRPWWVEVNPTSGVVAKPVEVTRIDPPLAVIKSELGRWVEAMYTIDPQRTDGLQRWAVERSADKALAQGQEFRTRERVYERVAREPETVREARVTAVDASQKGTAFVFVTTTDRTGTASPAADQIRKYRVTLNYKLLPPTDEGKLLANPLGLYVTFFSDVEERTK